MKLLHRNKQLIYYRLFVRKGIVTDSEGYESGEDDLVYSDPHSLRCSVSHATGNSHAELFGTLDNYDKVIITEDTDCPIDENTILVVDHVDRVGEPSFHDFIVRRVAKSLNFIAYAISRVDVRDKNSSIELMYAVDSNGEFAVSGGVRARATA